MGTPTLLGPSAKPNAHAKKLAPNKTHSTKKASRPKPKKSSIPLTPPRGRSKDDVHNATTTNKETRGRMSGPGPLPPSPSSSSSSSSSSSPCSPSCLHPPAWPAPKAATREGPRIIHTCEPETLVVAPHEFMRTVQQLTGRSWIMAAAAPLLDPSTRNPRHSDHTAHSHKIPRQIQRNLDLIEKDGLGTTDSTVSGRSVDPASHSSNPMSQIRADPRPALPENPQNPRLQLDPRSSCFDIHQDQNQCKIPNQSSDWNPTMICPTESSSLPSSQATIMESGTPTIESCSGCDDSIGYYSELDSAQVEYSRSFTDFQFHMEPFSVDSYYDSALVLDQPIYHGSDSYYHNDLLDLIHPYKFCN